MPEGFGASVVGIGIFDGVHRGHAALLRTVQRIAENEGILSVAYTFDPHPARVLNPARAPLLIEPVERRCDRLAALGFDMVIVEPFSREFASTPAEAYVRDILVGRLHARRIVVGADFTFGKDRGGNVHLLQQMGAELGFTTHPIALVQDGGAPASSTRIRALVQQGDVAQAAVLMGRPYELTGTVVRGAGRGEGLGFGTANLQPQSELLPGLGIYAARAHGPFGTLAAAVSVGTNPTFGDGKLSIEAHLLDYQGGPLYDAQIRVEFLAWLRHEARFDDIDALKAQIADDVARTRTIVGGAA